jgi:hypothetical protein
MSECLKGHRTMPPLLDELFGLALLAALGMYCVATLRALGHIEADTREVAIDLHDAVRHLGALRCDLALIEDRLQEIALLSGKRGRAQGDPQADLAEDEEWDIPGQRTQPVVANVIWSGNGNGGTSSGRHGAP